MLLADLQMLSIGIVDCSECLKTIELMISGNAEMAEGTIKKVMDKGFGFIATSSGKDLFFHSSAVQGTSFNELREGQKVTYTEGMGQKGPCAENVKPV
jgi:CspA family cold shock protein